MNTRLFKLAYFAFDHIRGRVMSVAWAVEDALDVWGGDEE